MGLKKINQSYTLLIEAAQLTESIRKADEAGLPAGSAHRLKPTVWANTRFVQAFLFFQCFLRR
jgi:hypothetical protein